MPGSPISAVEVLLAQEHFDLVLVGATGVGRAGFFGSVATGMIRAANTNVLVVPTTALIQPLERATSEIGQVTGDILQPGHYLVFVLRLAQTGAQTSRTADEHYHPDGH